MKQASQGLATIEFALAGSVLLTMMLAVVEFGRLIYTWNTAIEGTRRGARLAAVCPVTYADTIKRAALMTSDTSSGATSPYISGLGPSNVTITYRDFSGNAIGNPAGNMSSIATVSVSITGYSTNLLIPGFNLSLGMPDFTTTVPAESLGYIPDDRSYQCLAF